MKSGPAMHSGELDCQACGACCFSDSPTSVRVSGDDHARLAELAEALTLFVGNRCYMRLAPASPGRVSDALAGHCAALTRNADGRFGCSVYARRPDVCRDLERGSPACRAERHQKSDRT